MSGRFLLAGLFLLLFWTDAFAQAPCPGPLIAQDWIRCHNDWVINGQSRDQDSPSAVRVTQVVDGNTIRLDSGHYVRLIGIDTPESVDRTKHMECFGPEASAFTRSAALGKVVRLVADPLAGKVDVYGRLLAYVLLEDGTNLNAAIVRLGMGYVEIRFPFERMREFLDMQSLAKNERRGLWGACSRWLPEKKL